jgi:hypothetical protein
MFSERSCVIFVSLAERFACVTKATQYTEAVTGYKNSYLRNQNVNTIIPQSIAPFHDQLLRNYIRAMARVSSAN